jgi:chromosome partitioning protein
MHTIVLATQKGGSGKSTLAIGLALAAKHAGFTVRLIETDPQGTLSNWQRRRTADDLVVEPIYHAADIEPRLKMLADSGLQLAIVDTAAGLSAATTAAIRHSDLCLIPARPSVADIEATASTLSVARAWKRPYSFVLNQTPIRGQRIANAATTLGVEAAREMDEVLARPFIVMRNDHQDALAAGLGVSEFSPYGKSADEVRDLWTWVEQRLAGVAMAEAEVEAIQAFEEVQFPIILSPQHIKPTATEDDAGQPSPIVGDTLTWDAGL